MHQRVKGAAAGARADHQCQREDADRPHPKHPADHHQHRIAHRGEKPHQQIAQTRLDPHQRKGEDQREDDHRQKVALGGRAHDVAGNDAGKELADGRHGRVRPHAGQRRAQCRSGFGRQRRQLKEQRRQERRRQRRGDHDADIEPNGAPREPPRLRRRRGCRYARHQQREDQRHDRHLQRVEPRLADRLRDRDCGIDRCGRVTAQQDAGDHAHHQRQKNTGRLGHHTFRTLHHGLVPTSANRQELRQ